MNLPPHLVADLMKLIVMQVASVILVRLACIKLYGIDLFDFKKTPGMIFGGVITLGTFYGLYTTLTDKQKLQEIGEKIAGTA